MAPYVHTLCDYPEPAVAVSHTSPVIHSYAPYPQSCIPAAVPNPEAHLPNQVGAHVALSSPAHHSQLYGQVPPGQRWARPMPDEAPTKSRRTSIQQTHPRRQSSFDHGAPSHSGAPAPGHSCVTAHTEEYVPAQFHQAAFPPTHVQAYAQAVSPVAYQNYHAPVQHHVQPQHHPEPHPYRTEPQPYHAQPQQYYADRVQHQVDPQPQYQNAVSDQSYGLYAPHEHANHQQAAQTASFETFDGQLDAEDLLLNSPYSFEAPGDLEVPVPAQQDFAAGHDHQQFESAQNYRHVETQQAQQFHHQPQLHHHQHVVPQMNADGVVPSRMHTTVAPSQMHTAVAASQVHASPQMHTNIAPGYAHHPGHVRRASGFEAPREQVSFQAAHHVPQHDAFAQNHQDVHPQNHQHVHTQNLPHAHTHTHAHHGSPQTTRTQTTHHPALGSTNPLQYPSAAQGYAETQSESEPESESESARAEPEQTPQRLQAIGYQRTLEDEFRKRARRFGDNVGSAFGPEHQSQGEQQEGGEEPDEAAVQAQQHHHYHQHQCQQPHQAQQPQPQPSRVQPIVPSQAHERAPPAASGSQVDKKDVPAPPKKPALACLFCRKRKIACGPPPPDSPDRTCNQCMRRKQECVYPSESRRGIRKTPKEPTAPIEDQPTVHTFVHDDGSSLGDSSGKGKGRRKRAHELVD